MEQQYNITISVYSPKSVPIPDVKLQQPIRRDIYAYLGITYIGICEVIFSDKGVWPPTIDLELVEELTLLAAVLFQ